MRQSPPEPFDFLTPTIEPKQKEHGSGTRNSLDFCAQRDETLAQMLDQPEEHDQPETLDQLPPFDESPSGSMSPVGMWWPIIGASVVITCLSIAVSVAQVCRTYPHDPWESIIIADAYRYSVGMPVYTNPQAETGHATHMYGPLLIYAVGLIFKWKGVNVVAAHLVPQAATIWVIAALAVIYFRRLPRVAQIAGVAILFSLNTRLHGLPTGLHTDMPALGFALLALILMFQAVEKGRWVCFPLALSSFCVAYLFKQTAAAFTIVPLLSLLLRRQWSPGTLLAVAAPLASIMGLIVALSIIAPNVHFYMITGVRRWPMRFDVLLASPLRFLSYYILLPIALCTIILIRPITFSEPKIRWLISAGFGTLPGGLLAYSKVGGAENSFLPSLMPLLVFSTLVIAAAWETTCAVFAWPGRASMFGWLIALVMMVDGIETSRDALSLFPEGNGDEHYPQVIEYVRRLKGRVLCPEDPTIPILALGQLGRSYWAENDTQQGASWLPPLQKEITRADYVVIINSPNKIIAINGQALSVLGFESTSWDGTDMGIYELWRKREAGEGNNGSSPN